MSNLNIVLNFSQNIEYLKTLTFLSFIFWILFKNISFLNVVKIQLKSSGFHSTNNFTVNGKM